MDKLFVEDSAGSFKEASDKAILSVAYLTAKKKFIPGVEVDGPKSAKKLLIPLLAGKDYEVFCVAFLDPSHKLIAFEEMFRGSVTQTPAYPREVFKRALELNATGVLLVHNHPSGTTEASDADIMTTLRMKMVGGMMEIEVLDHFIVAGNNIGSMREAGDFSPDKVMKVITEQMGGSLNGVIHSIEITANEENIVEKIKDAMKSLSKKLN